MKKRFKSKVGKIRKDKKADFIKSENDGDASVEKVKNSKWEQQITASVFEDYNASSLSTAKANWYFGEWQELADINLNSLSKHPDLAKLAALKAAGFQQLNDLENCKKHVEIARTLGCDNKIITKLLVAGVHNSLGKLSALKQNDDKTNYHFNAAIDIGEISQTTKLASQARTIKELSKLGLLPQATKIFDSQLNFFEETKYSSIKQDASLKLLKKEQLALKVSTKLSTMTISKEQTKLILIASMPRSGSTWLFNCTKEILLRSKKSLYSCWIGDYDAKEPSEIHLVKVHDPIPELSEKADIILSSRRDIREIAASLVRMEWDEKGDDFFAQLSWIVNTVHSYWFGRTNYEIEYNQILIEPEKLVEEVGHTLQIPINPKESVLITNKLANLKLPRKYDKKTQLHPKHRAKFVKHYSEILNENTINDINGTFSQWLDKFNYLK